MKVKLSKSLNKELIKADRSGLVKVAVQVNGRHGTYQSHRWKNAGAALQLLAKELLKQNLGSIDDLEFKNKETGNKLNKDDLIKEYKQSKTTETLQDYVKKNYTILKQKSGKVGNKKDTVTMASETPNKKVSVYDRLERLKVLDSVYDKGYDERAKVLGEKYFETPPHDTDLNRTSGYITKRDINLIRDNYENGNISMLPETLSGLYDSNDEGKENYSGSHRMMVDERYTQNHLYYDGIYNAIDHLKAGNYQAAQRNIDDIEMDSIRGAGKNSVYKQYQNMLKDGLPQKSDEKAEINNENPPKFDINNLRTKDLAEEMHLSLDTSKRQKTYVAEISGVGGQYGFDRSFLKETYDHGYKQYDLNNDTIYEVVETGTRSYIYTYDDKAYYVDKDDVKEYYEKIDQEKREKLQDELGGEFKEAELEGTSRQVSWAEDLRNSFKSEYLKDITKMNNIIKNSDNEKQKILAQKYIDAYKSILNDSSAKNWISVYRYGLPIIDRLLNIANYTDWGHTTVELVDEKELPNLNNDTSDNNRRRAIMDYTYKIGTAIGDGGLEREKSSQLIYDAVNALEDYKQSGDDTFWDVLRNVSEGGFSAVTVNIRATEEENAQRDEVDSLTTFPVGNSLLDLKNFKTVKDKANINLIKDTDEDVSKNLYDIYSMKFDIAGTVLSIERDPEYFERVLKNQKLDPNSLTDSLNDFNNLLNCRSLKFWNEAIEQGLELDEISKKYKAEMQQYDNLTNGGFTTSPNRTQKNNWNAMKRYGTKKLEHQGEYFKQDSLKATQEQLKPFKNMHTDVVARAAMDMLGIEAPLYVKRNGKPLRLGRKLADGYCQYKADGFNQVIEIAVVDHPDDRRQSYKTTIHECMHAMLAKTRYNEEKRSLAHELNTKNHEGMVEIIAQASTKDFYGREESKDMTPSYVSYVADTALRLRQMDQFKGKSITEIGRELGDMASRQNKEELTNIVDYLNNSSRQNRKTPVDEVNNMMANNKELLDQKANKLKADKGDNKTSELGNLVEELKKGTITLSQALASSQYGDIAALLIVEFLDDDEEELEGLM